jgi:hypothetical protein
MEHLEKLQRETELLDILSENIKILEIVKPKYKKQISEQIENWLDDKYHAIWTNKFKDFLEDFINDVRRKKLNRIINK